MGWIIAGALTLMIGLVAHRWWRGHALGPGAAAERLHARRQGTRPVGDVGGVNDPLGAFVQERVRGGDGSSPGSFG